MVQQLHDIGCSLPVVIFYTGVLPSYSHTSFSLLNASTRPMNPRMPLPEQVRSDIARGNGGVGAWEKLGLWAQTSFQTIVFLDIDAVILRNFDEMALFPGDTFTPEVCNTRCEHHAAGINTGVMVIRPSERRFTRMVRFLGAVAAEMASTSEASKRDILRRKYFGSSDQSFIREFFTTVLNAAVASGHKARAGYNFTVVSYRHGIGSNPGRVNVASRMYNARPFECERCPASFRPKIVHYACSRKPWQHSGDRFCRHTLCDTCERRWTEKWFIARWRVCRQLSALADDLSICRRLRGEL